MTKEEIYLRHKKQELIKHVKAYNKNVCKAYQFPIYSQNLDIEKTFCNTSICKGCGDCCCTFPCKFAPSDFFNLNDLEYMSKLLDTGVICISEDYYTKNLLIRPRGIGDFYIVSTNQRIKYTIDGYNPCLLHSKEGCLLPAEYRPSEGLLYYPVNSFEHYIMYKEKDIEKEYEFYKEALNKLFFKYYDEKRPLNEAKSEENINKLIRCIAGYKK